VAHVKRAKSDQIDGVVGEMSRFYESFGFYGHGVSVTTAVVPDGWRERLVPLSSPATGAARGWCLEPHDLAVSKFVRGEPKDYRFADALVRAGYLDPGVLVDRLASTRGSTTRLGRESRAGGATAAAAGQGHGRRRRGAEPRPPTSPTDQSNPRGTLP
jgi:hypothetical protein